MRVKVWQKVPNEEHLICEFHLDFWLDGSAVPVAIEFAPVLTQHWWIATPFGVTQTKEMQTYTAVVKYGATTLDSRINLQHAYHCRWASLRSDDDAHHARKHWINLGSTAMPTVRVRYSDASLKTMMRAGYIPPLRLGVAYASDTYDKIADATSGGMTSTYGPLSRNGHRSSIAASGGYVGRGMWGDPDAKLVCRQSQAAATAELAWRTARVMAQAGMSMYAHVRDHRSTSGVNGGTDAPNRLIPQSFRKAATLGISQSYPGLGAHCVYARGSIAETAGLTLLSHSAPSGGSGALTNYNAQHAHNYCAPMGFLEGEAYLGDAAVSQFNMTCHYLNWNRYSHDNGPYDWDATARKNARGIPTATGSGYGSLPDIAVEERSLGWSLNLLGTAYAIRADSHPEQPFIKNMVRNVDLSLSDSYGYYNATDRARGTAYTKYTREGTTSPWMANWQAMAAYQLMRLVDFLPDNARDMTGIEETAFLSARRLILRWPNSLYSGNCYRTAVCTDSTGDVSIPSDEWGEFMSVTWSGGVGTCTLKVGDGGGPMPGMKFNAGDKLRFPKVNTNYSLQTLPTGVDSSTLYYLINVTSAVNTANSTFQISTSPGGSAVSVGNGVAVSMITPQDFNISTLGPAGTRFFPNDDSYLPISLALFEQAVAEGHPDLTSEIITTIRDFCAPKVASYSAYAAWNYSADSLA